MKLIILFIFIILIDINSGHNTYRHNIDTEQYKIHDHDIELYLDNCKEIYYKYGYDCGILYIDKKHNLDYSTFKDYIEMKYNIKKSKYLKQVKEHAKYFEIKKYG